MSAPRNSDQETATERARMFRERLTAHPQECELIRLRREVDNRGRANEVFQDRVGVFAGAEIDHRLGICAYLD